MNNKTEATYILPGDYFVAGSQESTYCIGFNFWSHLLIGFIVFISRLWVVVVSGFTVCVNWRNPETVQCLSPISLLLHRSTIVLREADIIDCLFITVKARMKWVCFFSDRHPVPCTHCPLKGLDVIATFFAIKLQCHKKTNGKINKWEDVLLRE